MSDDNSGTLEEIPSINLFASSTYSLYPILSDCVWISNNWDKESSTPDWRIFLANPFAHVLNVSFVIRPLDSISPDSIALFTSIPFIIELITFLVLSRKALV